MYWKKDNGSLSSLIESADLMESEDIMEYGKKAIERIDSAFSWKFIGDRYAQVFLNRGK